MSNTYTLSTHEKFRKFKNCDPLPNIKSSLLNSADIKSYVEATGLIDPFYEDDLKSASYAARIAGKCKYWDEEKNNFVELVLENSGDKLILKPNAIAFVGIEPTFRLPDYIALRFNLKITHVYRGLLLGTGPLIDPGFVGQISIPLHNLTSNEYVFSFEEQLIWIEFTKTTDLPQSKSLSQKTLASYEKNRCQIYKEFPENKTDKSLDYYIDKALESTPYSAIISSVPSAVNDALKYANEAKKSAGKAEKSNSTIKRWGIASAIVVFIGIASIIAGIVTIVFDSWSLKKEYYDDTMAQISIIQENSAENKEELSDSLTSLSNNFNNNYNELNAKIQKQEKLISKLVKEIQILKDSSTSENDTQN